QEITYSELHTQATRIAYLLQQSHVGPDTRVGICLERSPQMLAALLGILKAGGAYVPLDPAYPKERLAFIMKDAHISVLLTQQTLLAQLPEHDATVICLDTTHFQEPILPFAQRTLPDNLAYVIYTSGSTGKPKGVAMTHRSLTNLITWQALHSELGAGARTLQLTSLNFDVSFQEIFTTWSSGGTLVMATEVLRRDILSLPIFLARQRIERVFLPFVVLQQLAEAFLSVGYDAMHLREVVTAGEQLQITKPIMKLFREIEGCVLYNQYGPTETHVVTAFVLTGFSTFWPELPPIGRPIANSRVYILDHHLQLVPPGTVGELYIAGVALARGYLDRPELTAEKFIPNPFSQEPGTRLYKTGDLVRYLPDGHIVFLNRLDDQVKIRGHRIELGEIEIALRHHPRIREAVVLAMKSKVTTQRLIAYIVPEQEYMPTLADIHDFLGESLPAYMLPAILVVLEALPLTPNGKVDRKNLPLPEKNRLELDGHIVAPTTPTEKLLADIWADVLGLPQIGIHDNFFELGGDSILGLQVIARANQKGLQLVHRQIMQRQTVAELANV
ncbi:MAG: non-ribosomal peptide synthetase, partial [Ktedonobacteraceae bacterium]